MHPVLFRVGDFQVGSYALMALLALAAGCAVFSWLAARDGHSRMLFVEIGLWAFIIALVASKLFGAALVFDHEHPWDSVKNVLRFGGHYYIGVIAGVAFLVIVFRRLKVPFPTGLDYLAPGLALAHGIGRMGCLLAGCCWGAACELPWAITFPEGGENFTGVPQGIPLHPTQVYEFLAEMLIASFLLWKHVRHRGAPGTTFLWYAVLYGVARFLVEFVRDDPRGTLLGMPTSQPLAVISAVAAGVLLIVLAGRPRGRAARRKA